MLRAKDLESVGILSTKSIFYNLSFEDLREHELNSDLKGYERTFVTSLGATTCDTGKFTGRSPNDKYFVDEEPSNAYIAWGDINHKVSKNVYEKVEKIAKDELSNKDIYVMDLFVGASLDSRRNIRFITEVAWQAHFVKNMFISPTKDELREFKPDFTVYNAAKATYRDFKNDGLNSDVFVGFNINKAEAIIVGTWYGGEMKKGIFSMMNYWLPLEKKLPMHCSANVDNMGNSALFFGLSGTGKTTLSTDSKRALIGDDEHGWDDKGVFNFEGGCYAKVIDLSKADEPEIYGAIKENALLENVVVDTSGRVNFADDSKTQNTRVSYPIDHIVNYKKDMMADHPKNIIFLSADAYGILPPVSKLSKEQAMYYFLSGYTAKVAGTERGIDEPVATFSACFGEAFLPLHPTVYAKLLGEKIDQHSVNVFLVNTGWAGGRAVEYLDGNKIERARMSLSKVTRPCINAILDGTIHKCKFDTTDLFRFKFPVDLPGVDPKVLNPKNAWSDRDRYYQTREELAKKFIDNFHRYSDESIAKAGPNI
jgi:phosphoenolpyruvate carboxykinase (ATP)